MNLDRMASQIWLKSSRQRMVPFFTGPFGARASFDAKLGDPSQRPDFIDEHEIIDLRYQRRSFIRTFLMSAVYAAMSITILATAWYWGPAAPIISLIAWAVLGMVIFYTLRIGLRLFTCIRYTSTRIQPALDLPWTKAPLSLPTGVQWSDMSRLTLRRARLVRGSTPLRLEMTIVSPSGQVRVDPRLERFPRLLERAVWHAKDNHVPLDKRTMHILTDMKMGAAFGTTGEVISISPDPARYRDHVEKGKGNLNRIDTAPKETASKDKTAEKDTSAEPDTTETDA